jgi:dihydrofolate synthase / folylpolyglutamate synthase
MTYQNAIDFLFSALPMFQRIGQAAYKANLDNTRALDLHMGHPHQNFRTIHVAGTNGKGSVSHMLAAILQKAGYLTGLYTSPHLKDFRERIKINGAMIPEEEVVKFVVRNKKMIEQIEPSFFEMTVTMAFDFFSKQKANIAVIETGMGGRLDSTNIITPIVSVITNIGLDHIFFLGDTLDKIAAEKAGIIKPGVPVIIGEWQKETHEVFEEFARNNRSELYVASQAMRTGYSMMTAERLRIMDIYKENQLQYKGLVTSLPGKYQDKNILTVLQTIEILRKQGLSIPEESVYAGIREVKKLTGLAGRWDEIGYNPLTVCDTAHNREGLELVMLQVHEIPWKKLHIVFGTVNDKDPSPVLGILPREALYYFTRADIPRAMDPGELKNRAQKEGLTGDVYQTVKEALESARKKAEPEDMIFIGGSTFVVGEVI